MSGRTCPVAVIAPSIATVLLVACRDASPTEPTRYGTPFLRISCDPSGRSPLTCRASVLCSGPPCAPGTPDDVTQIAFWTSADPTIVRAIAPGTFEAAGPGDTFVQGAWQSSETRQTVSVLAGLPPQPTYEIFGSVFATGANGVATPIDGVVVEVVDGNLRGRMATSGVPPSLPPGFLGPFGGPGYYRLLAMPPGTYHLRVSKPGYASQDREVTVLTGSPNTDFRLQTQ